MELFVLSSCGKIWERVSRVDGAGCSVMAEAAGEWDCLSRCAVLRDIGAHK